MLTRPTIPSVLKVLSRAARDQAGAREFSESAASELFISSQMLSYLARRAELEPDQILEEMAIYDDLGHQVVREGLGEANTISRVLSELRAHRADEGSRSDLLTAYALSSEVLCLAIDATFSTTGAAHEAMVAAVKVRQINQANIVGDFVIGGR
jgi:hypothetical protein